MNRQMCQKICSNYLTRGEFWKIVVCLGVPPWTEWQVGSKSIYFKPQVKKSWNEAQATSLKRYNGANWSQTLLDLTGNDAGPDVIDTTTVFTYRPLGFIQFDVTDAVKNWRNGDGNYGVLLRATNELAPGRGIRFYSNAHSDPNKHAFIHVLCE